MTGADADGRVAARAVGVSRVYREGEAQVRALDGLSVEFPEGRFTAVMGPSGSGKSTLMHCLAGLDRVTSGEVWIGGTKLGDLSERQLTLLRREQVGFIFQAYNLLPTLTAAENIGLPLAIAGKKPEPAWYDRVIDAVGLRPRLGHRPTGSPTTRACRSGTRRSTRRTRPARSTGCWRCSTSCWHSPW